MTERHRLAFAVLYGVLAALTAGCPGDDDDPDGGPVPIDGELGPEVAIGTGGIERYVPIDDGDTVLMARGCQGGQHVWVGVRARGLDTEPALVSLSGVRVRDGQMVSIPITVRLRFVQDVADGWDEITGIQLVIPIADQAIDEEIDIRAQVAEDFRGGQMQEATRRVRVVWGGEVCGALGDGGLDGEVDDGGVPDGGVPEDGAAAD